jgi:hypothetical protein
VGGSKKLVLEQERELQNGEAYGDKDDRIKYDDDLSHPNPIGSR